MDTEYIQKMTLVSLEGLPRSCRHAILKALDTQLDRPESVPPRGFVDQARGLLRRMQALHASTPAITSDTWVDGIPDDPVLAALHRDLAVQLAGPDLCERVRHVMVYLRTDPHEAFENVAQAGGEAKDVSLLSLLHLHALADRFFSLPQEMIRHPFEVERHVVHCPPYAPDNPIEFARLVAAVRRLIAARQ
jgi:hypothetical protein